MKRILAGALSCVSLVGCFACGEQVVTDGKTINVRMVNAGYGSAWFEEIAEKFEALYAEEGYKVNLLEPENSLQAQTALNEMRLDYDMQKIDLYLTAGVYVESVLDKTFGECVEELTDMYAQGAINYDGRVEETPIKDTAGGSTYAYLLTDPKNPDKYYRYQWFTAPLGLVCNQKILKDYGFDYLPVTTNELFEMYDAIYYGANGKKGTKDTGVYPQTWAQANAASYPLYNYIDSFGSMLGFEGWDKFWSLDHLASADSDGSAYYESLETELKTSLEAFIHQYDTMYSYVGSTTQRHDMAHAQIAMGKAAFMADGAYFFNEVKTNFTTYLPNLRIIKQPTVSALGTILKLDGTGQNAEKCEEILAFLCRAFENGADQAEMKRLAEAQFQGITFTEEQIQKVWEARALNTVSAQADAYIAKGSPMKEEAKLLLRMMASPDAAKTMSKYCMSHSYYSVEAENVEYEFISDVSKLSMNMKKPVFYNYKLGLRKTGQVGMFPPMGLDICTKIMADIGVVENPKDRDYKALANSYYDGMIDNLDKHWAEYLKTAGF